MLRVSLSSTPTLDERRPPAQDAAALEDAPDDELEELDAPSDFEPDPDDSEEDVDSDLPDSDFADSDFAESDFAAGLDEELRLSVL